MEAVRTRRRADEANARIAKTVAEATDHDLSRWANAGHPDLGLRALARAELARRSEGTARG